MGEKHIISGVVQTPILSFAQVHKLCTKDIHTHTHTQFSICNQTPLSFSEGETLARSSLPSFCVGSPKFRPSMKAKFSMTRRRLLCRKCNQPELLGVLMNYSSLERDNGLSGSIFFCCCFFSPSCRIRHLSAPTTSRNAALPDLKGIGIFSECSSCLFVCQPAHCQHFYLGQQGKSFPQKKRCFQWEKVKMAGSKGSNRVQQNLGGRGSDQSSEKFNCLSTQSGN